jgi:hypothetical protein
MVRSVAAAERRAGSALQRSGGSAVGESILEGFVRGEATGVPESEVSGAVASRVGHFTVKPEFRV